MWMLQSLQRHRMSSQVHVVFLGRAEVEVRLAEGVREPATPSARRRAPLIAEDGPEIITGN